MATATAAKKKAAVARTVEMMPARYTIDTSILRLAERTRDTTRAIHERSALLEERLDQISSVLEEASSFLDELDSCTGRLVQRVGLDQ